ncbi:hypothetical protein ACKKBF_B40755 [Auxenochlorella protothecoides x Auxenochlorella symbiontica]
MLLLLSLGVFARGACSTKFYALPAVTYGPHVYMLEVSSADNICRSQGYSKAGSVKASTLNDLGISVSAIKLSPFEIIKNRSTRILVAVECLRAGQKACTADKDGNIGTGNKGKNNFGDKNVGDNNIGISNKGNLNWEVVAAATQEEGVAATATQEGVPTAAAQEGVPTAAAQEGVPAPTEEGVPAPTEEGIPAPTEEGIPAPSQEGVPAISPCRATTFTTTS